MSLADFQPSADSPEAVEAEVLQLITDLRDAARDARVLADRFADVLRGTVEEYCVEFEQRADHLLARLERTR